MKITGVDAVRVLQTLTDYVDIHKKDNNNKFWSYKLKSAKRTEFAFDPKTKEGLYVRVDREPPSLPGITDIERILGKATSTALDRVFSGGIHKATYKVTIETESALRAFIAHYLSIEITQ
ncbi:hypothetical protein KW841_27525 [Pseudomonas sp. PDM28]|uniref:hypothetical protein n=1 Tax=Pseudomonas sp. PDM28 TaxID=2854770 RepID=UPI001C43EA3B|nr:hypothetical protein [Pseudomonas sp. PDM28]MBV7556106.1 hypothetical protein [Pseudomonas sp. PDM28]